MIVPKQLAKTIEFILGRSTSGAGAVAVIVILAPG
jgi:hypothetical protein